MLCVRLHKTNGLGDVVQLLSRLDTTFATCASSCSLHFAHGRWQEHLANRNARITCLLCDALQMQESLVDNSQVLSRRVSFFALVLSAGFSNLRQKTFVSAFKYGLACTLLRNWCLLNLTTLRTVVGKSFWPSEAH